MSFVEMMRIVVEAFADEPSRIIVGSSATGAKKLRVLSRND